MSATTQGPYSTSADLETTADYPPAPPAAPADTWVIPPRPTDGGAEDPLRAYHEEVRTLRQSVAGITLVRDQLQADLSALTTKRHELEELLLTRDALLSKHERELSARHDEIGKLSKSLAAATTGRDTLRAELTALSTKRHEHEELLLTRDALLSKHERELSARQDEIGKLSKSLAAATTGRDTLQAELTALSTKRHEHEELLLTRDALLSKHERELSARQDEIGKLRESLAAAATGRDALQAEVTAQSTKRQELEELLLTRDAVLSKHERELSARQDEIGKLSESLAAATTGCDTLQAALTAQSTKPQELEQPSPEGEAQRLEHERTLAARDQRLAELKEELGARAEQQFLLAAERDDLRARLERSRADLNSIAQRRERQTRAQADAEREHARRDAALARGHEDLTELQRRVAGHRDALQRAEARRQVFEAMLRDREELLDERDARLRTLQDELEQQRRDHRAALERANAQLAAALVPASGTERHFGQSIQSTQAPAVELAPAALASAAADPEAQRRIAALEAELAEVQGTVCALQEQLQDARGENEALHSDLAAAELQLHEAGSDLRHTNARVTQLEAEAAPDTPSLPAGQQLLVRTVGDTGIVHALGRRTTIGRVPANDVCIDTELVSRHHAVVLVTDTGTVVEDLNSTNGVFINDVRVMRQELREGDVLTFGTTSFRYVLKRDANTA